MIGVKNGSLASVWTEICASSKPISGKHKEFIEQLYKHHQDLSEINNYFCPKLLPPFLDN